MRGSYNPEHNKLKHNENSRSRVTYDSRERLTTTASNCRENPDVVGLSEDVYFLKEKMNRYKRDQWESTKLLQSENDELWQENGRLREQEQAKSRDLIMLKQDHEKLTGQLEDARNDVFRKERSARKDYQVRFNDMEDMNKQINKELKDCKEKLEKMASEKDYYRRKVENLDLGKKDLESTKGYYNRKMETLEHERNEMERQQKAFERKFGNYQVERHELEHLERKGEMLESEKQDLEKHMNYYKSKFEAVECEKSDLRNKYDLMQNDINTIKNENRNYIESQDNENQELEQKLQKMIENFEFEQRDFRIKIEILEAQKKELEVELMENLRSYESEQSDSKKRIDSLTNEQELSKKSKHTNVTEYLQRLETLQKEKNDQELAFPKLKEDQARNYDFVKQKLEDETKRAEDYKYEVDILVMEKDKIQQAYEHMEQTIYDYEKVFTAQKNEQQALRDNGMAMIGDDGVSSGNLDLLKTAAEDYDKVLIKLKEFEELCDMLKTENKKLNDEVLMFRQHE